MLRKTYCSSVAVAVAIVGVFLIAFCAARSDDGGRLGVLLVVLGTMLYLSRQMLDAITASARPTQEAWQDGYDLGYEQAHREISEARRGQLVQLPRIANN